MQSPREAFAKSKVNGQKMSFLAEVSLACLRHEEKNACFEEHLQYKFKPIFAPIAEACGCLRFGASTPEVIFYFSASASGASEENLRNLLTILLENAMKSAPKGIFQHFSSRNL